MRRPTILDTEPPEVVVVDEITPCPYLAGRRARLPLRLPLRPLTWAEWDTHLAAGDRRHGPVLYRPSCPECTACEAIRVDVARFVPSRSHRRTVAPAGAQGTNEVGPPVTNRERIDLYEKHLEGRGLRMADHTPLTTSRYKGFLVESCCDTIEMRYRIGDRLVGVAVADRGARSLSAHYTYYDPELAHLSLGTFSILAQIDLCRGWRLEHLYLGLYIADNDSMRYKARFKPHERLVEGAWRPFERE
jgi:arginine-tRNA-protein transferase